VDDVLLDLAPLGVGEAAPVDGEDAGFLGSQQRATPAAVVRLILADALRLATAGILVGIPLVYASTRLVGGMLFGLTPTDPSTIAIGSSLVAITALIAGSLPAIRAVRINPVVALKAD